MFVLLSLKEEEKVVDIKSGMNLEKSKRKG
jgi:hypothetical protein